MAEIIKSEKLEFPRLRLVGRRYTEADRKNGSFGEKWGEWFGNGLFAPLERLPRPESVEAFDGSYIGAMRMLNGEFEYWIGMFLPEGGETPEGYEQVSLPGGSCALLWIHGSESTGEIYGMEAVRLCYAEMERRGWKELEGGWQFERYNCPRFTAPDQDGKVILDYGIFLEQ